MTYYALMIAATAVSLFSGKHKKVTTAVLVGVLALFAGTRLAVDNDYAMYAAFFAAPGEMYARFGALGLEPAIYAVPALAHLLLPTTEAAVRASFLVFAFLGVGTKITAISRSSRCIPISVALYVTYLFLMQEMTTIRAGVACGLFLLSLPHLVRRQWWHFLGYMAAALLFHTSSVLFLIAGALLALRLRLRYYFAALGLSFVIAAIGLNLVALLHLDAVFPKIGAYVEMETWAKSAQLNLFNFRILFALLMLAVFTVLHRRFRDVEYFGHLLRIHIFSLVVFFALSPLISVFSIRAFEMLSVVQILLYPMVLVPLAGRTRWLAIAGLLAFSAAQAYFLVDVSGVFKPYESWLF